ncbi:MAG TPA: CRISPR-associated endonuclease Cas1 [Candidatus Cybelea sp.]|jgi:CRISPR-associated protein Cas1|nr:CRISPR-associated endonuclease Cas1 [Candidatus Cybelea sp.]
MQQQTTSIYPPLQVRAGVLVVDGYGIALRVLNRGKLRVEDGLGRQRRSIVLDRAGCGLERLVLIGHAGYVTLEALAWLRAIGAALVQIGRDGEVLAHSVPYGYDGHPIRRAQALAVTNGLDLAITRELIAAKLDGQRRILVRLGADLREFDKLRAAIDAADSIERARVIEANAAALYFSAWRDVRIRFRGRDLARIPKRWLRCDSRASVLTGAPRAATSPINAMRNYLFACLESEARLALLAQGCDPAMGVLHADQRNRDSLALDAMEPVRADVDAFLLDLLEDREFTARDFGELPNGVCRIAAPLTHELALTLPHWRECLRPIAASLAQTFRESLVNKGVPPRTLAAKSGNKRRSVPGPQQSPLLATPRKASAQRPYATRKWRAPTVEAGPANPIACALCGEPVLKRRRRHCEACMPKARREHGLRAIEAARKALAAQTAAGNDPRRSADVNRARGEAISEGHRLNRSWAREHPGQRDEAWFKREVAPKLDGFPLAEIAKATCLSLAACSRIRAGAKVPHPRHWEGLRALVDQ